VGPLHSKLDGSSENPADFFDRTGRTYDDSHSHCGNGNNREEISQAFAEMSVLVESERLNADALERLRARLLQLEGKVRASFWFTVVPSVGRRGVLTALASLAFAPRASSSSSSLTPHILNHHQLRASHEQVEELDESFQEALRLHQQQCVAAWRGWK
jgi:hypothetical protein